MKIIDAHLHFRTDLPYFIELAKIAGHENTEAHLTKIYEDFNITGGIVMSGGALELNNHQYPSYLKYCVGIQFLDGSPAVTKTMLDEVELHLKQERCSGIKLYPGYQPTYLSDPMYEPLYELSESYDKAVAIHMGLTARSEVCLKYCHPLTLDEVAAKHPAVQFVMCHFGNPFLIDSAAVMIKNHNVATDLSGLLEGRVEIDGFIREYHGYVEQLKTWLHFFNRYEDVMFGTDWPLVNLGEYIDFIARVIPQKYHEKVFFENANRIYKMGL